MNGPDGWPVFSTLAAHWPVVAVPVDARAADFYTLSDGQIVMGPRAVFRRLAENAGLAASSGLTGTSAPADEERVLYNFAHHMAHAWVPKRAYGEGCFPFQWELAPLLDSIWFAEGFGQYAAIMALAAERPDPAAYRRQMLTRRFQSNISTAPAFLKRLPLAELSRVASTRYSEDFRTGRLVFSRGGLMAAAIDERIQAESKGTKSLRDALRFLVAWSSRERRGFRIDELAGLIQQATGVDTRAVIAEWLRPLQ